MLNIAKPGVSSFLEGYKARNLAANKVTIDFHVEEMIRLIDKLKQVDDEEAEKLTESLRLLKIVIETVESTPYYENTKLLGEILNNYVTSIQHSLHGKKDLIKKIIYQYLNLAKKLEGDEKVKNIATQLAGSYQSRFPIE